MPPDPLESSCFAFHSVLHTLLSDFYLCAPPPPLAISWIHPCYHGPDRYSMDVSKHVTVCYLPAYSNGCNILSICFLLLVCVHTYTKYHPLKQMKFFSQQLFTSYRIYLHFNVSTLHSDQGYPCGYTSSMYCLCITVCSTPCEYISKDHTGI